MGKSKTILLSPKLKREIMLAERFVARLKAKKEIPLRTMLMMKNRMSALHKKIKPIAELSKLEKDIDSAFLQIARAKVSYEQKLKIKKKVRTYGYSMLHRKKKR